MESAEIAKVWLTNGSCALIAAAALQLGNGASSSSSISGKSSDTIRSRSLRRWLREFKG